MLTTPGPVETLVLVLDPDRHQVQEVTSPDDDEDASPSHHTTNHHYDADADADYDAADADAEVVIMAAVGTDEPAKEERTYADDFHPSTH